ncbi:hypothetical protein MPSEU_000403700 [Mayamaea pseudoterrestris]|nr:hypothetical protein MPSEU_000403700 [Mayamaea pseudoterrestris]
MRGLFQTCNVQNHDQESLEKETRIQGDNHFSFGSFCVQDTFLATTLVDLLSITRTVKLFDRDIDQLRLYTRSTVPIQLSPTGEWKMQQQLSMNGGSMTNPEHQPLIIENVEILERDKRIEQNRLGNDHFRSDSSSEAFLGTARNSPSDAPAVAHSQPPPRTTAINYGTHNNLQVYSPQQTRSDALSRANSYQPSRLANGISTFQSQHAPPPYPHTSRSSKRARSIVSEPALPIAQPVTQERVSILSMDDIEQAFQVALNDQQPDYHQTDSSPQWSSAEGTGRGDVYMHPLKRDAPLRQNRNYGSIPAAPVNAATKRPPSPNARPPSPHRGLAALSIPKDHGRTRSGSPARQVNKSRSYTETSPQQLQRKQLDVVLAQRRRSLDAGTGNKSPIKQFQHQQTRQVLLSSPSQHGPQHRRHASLQSSHGDSVRSDVSLMSYRSDIRKSTYFDEFDSQTGKAKLNYPNSHVHLVMDESRSLVYGHVYAVPVHSSVYDEYYAALQDQEDGSLGFDFDVGNLNYCGCDCPNCATCRGKTALPPRFYAISVRNDLYRHVVDEISLSRSMPCGLFFCGYHEDVSRPSILIAVVVIGLLLVGMVVAAYLVAD